MNTVLFYGTTTGNTGDIATELKEQWCAGEIDLFDVVDVSLNIVSEYDTAIFAIPTWDYGEVQEDWQDVWDEVEGIDFSAKHVAFIGLGDQFGYPEWFVDAMGMLHDKVVAQGASVVGYWSTEGYEFDESKALTEDKKHFVGLALDEDWQREQSAERLVSWLSQINLELGIV
ncbi:MULTISPECIES: flavodoxin [unclassified Neptuniibacter]|uniref:flavodoxin n=1 Tax=unclassified Neptuniibacter TaxID=2630693 RepID=UPI000C35719F|nr:MULTISPECIES: flavodoxin [unclassified Neptuniibacter]MAY43033.1 flavodoxin [Oceanospirillaceae bacterium]|tara:strand:+ start:43322 stop:43837 length:516 start_codon:yes stop_codon:yes gene_type:complete